MSVLKRAKTHAFYFLAGSIGLFIILALLSSLFSILTLGSNNLLKEDKKTIEDKLYKLSLTTKFNFLLIENN